MRVKEFRTCEHSAERSVERSTIESVHDFRRITRIACARLRAWSIDGAGAWGAARMAVSLALQSLAAV